MIPKVNQSRNRIKSKYGVIGMQRGIIYVMTTAVGGVIKIGKTGSENFKERMRFLEGNGYYNVVGLKRFFAMELVDYEDKEILLQEIFATSRVGTSELFALDHELVKQLLLAFAGRVIFPENLNREQEFDNTTRLRSENNRFSFYRKGIAKGERVFFLEDEELTIEVFGEREVLYQGEVWKLSPLAKHLYQQLGQVNSSGAYQGARHFKFAGRKLKDLPDVKD